ncbi:hypothetical protein CERSUDRAFT_42528 [Gelatoporia subvermispora B]|uniref:Anaphase-promoting complex subunit 4 n=1 Tax=Ceriporiopsis subvermispora (strain B) TaxID=914234 RepID=M2QY30_CERS8|nr:hypothetical protein CERSUDRAFT_42528 [Gelatoporia subvermispora B]
MQLTLLSKTGSAHSILKGQPLLDPLQDDSQRLTTADLFAFRGAQARAAGEPSLPSVISSWPSLPTDSSAASIKPTTVGGTYCDETLDEDDNLNLDSVLAVSLDSGHLHCFVDGSFPLGAIALPDNHSVVSLVKTQDLLCAHLAPSDSLQPSSVALHPCIIQVPHLTQRALRDVARVSSSARELTWYTMRVVKEMRATWFGSESQGGVRELGPKWMRALEKRQKEDFGVHEPNAMLDLTSLLATGRASESLSDFFGSGDQMSERGLQKWESSVVDALTKLRNYAEKRVAPACQRLHLLLEEVQGWSQLPQYKACDFRTGDIDDSLQLVSRAIVIANWLAAATRREMIRFKEFMAWLRYETSRLNTDPHNPPPLRHDILEVNDYMMSGLVASPIDKWFMGPVPQLLPKDLGVATEPLELSTMMQKARHALKEPNQLSGQSPAKHKDLSHLDRNLDSLIQDFASRCQRIFAEASHATARSAIITPRSIPARIGGSTVRDVAAGSEPLVRERTTVDREVVCIARLQHSLQGGPSVQLSVAAMQCCIPRENEAGDRVPMHILDAEFFDESTLIVVYRFESEKGSAFLATVGYSELSFQLIESRDYVNELAREDLMVDLLEHLRKGQLSYAPIPVIRSRKLRGCTEGKVNLAVPSAMAPNSPSPPSKASSGDDSSKGISEAAMRKKKNADAQAAFRARRANYIATLEETVTNLEAVVIQLQNSCKEARNEVGALREENARLRQEVKHRERMWRRFSQMKGADHSPDSQSEDYPPLSPYPSHTPPCTANSMAAANVSHYPDDTMRYSTDQQPMSYHPGAQDYQQRSPALGFAGVDPDASADGRIHHINPQRVSRYGEYAPYQMDAVGNSDGAWQNGAMSNAGDPAGLEGSSAAHSPTYIESPSLTASDLSYPSRYQLVDEQKIPLAPLNTSAPYMFAASRSISPAVSTPTSTASSVSSTPFQFTFPESAISQDRPDFGYRRHNGGPELMLHGGTADISLLTSRNDPTRYALGSRNAISQTTSPYSTVENGSNDDTDSASYPYSARTRGRPGLASQRASRSPSPGPPAICGTLAVIKAQAFGALRRTRTKTKRGADGAAKAAVDALEARGINMGIALGPASKRARHHHDDDMQT